MKKCPCLTLGTSLYLSYEDMAGPARTVTVPSMVVLPLSAQVPYSSTNHDAVA